MYPYTCTFTCIILCNECVFRYSLLCLLQAGMDTLQEWDFDKYSQSAAKKALNHNIKHVMKEGGRAGKALMINTDKLISTVQILGTAGGAAKAVQAISVTTGVMSALFLALDVFFLAKDSHELRKGAKTKFANKIRDVCKELQDGLLELNKVKTQLQKTMDGIEVEEYEEIHEVEVEVDDLASDPKKLAELEHELDLLEEKLNKKMEEDEKKCNEMKKAKGNAKGTKTGEDKNKLEDQDGNKETLKAKQNKETKLDSKLEITDEKNEQKNQMVNSAKVKVVRDTSLRESKTETENSVTAGKKNQGSRNDTNKEKEKIKNKEHDKYAQHESKQEQHGRAHLKRESERSKSRRDAERESHTKKEVDHGRKVEERQAMDRRAEMSKKSEEMENSGTRREDDFRPKSHPSQMRQDHPEHESTNPREEYKRHHTKTAVAREEPMEARVRGGNGSIRKHSGSTQDKEKVERRKSRDGERDKEGRRSHRGSRGRSSILLEDGLYI